MESMASSAFLLLLFAQIQALTHIYALRRRRRSHSLRNTSARIPSDACRKEEIEFHWVKLCTTFGYARQSVVHSCPYIYKWSNEASQVPPMFVVALYSPSSRYCRCRHHQSVFWLPLPCDTKRQKGENENTKIEHVAASSASPISHLRTARWSILFESFQLRPLWCYDVVDVAAVGMKNWQPLHSLRMEKRSVLILASNYIPNECNFRRWLWWLHEHLGMAFRRPLQLRRSN